MGKDSLHWRPAIMLYDDRSGSTLLASLIAAHNSIVVTIEGDIFWRAIGLPNAPMDRRQTANLIEGTLNEAKVRQWGVSGAAVSEWCDRLAAGSGCTPATVVTAILAAYVDRVNPTASICVIKHGDVFKIPVYQTYFRDIKFIHIYRDGRAVFASKLKSMHSRDRRAMARDPISAALKWKKIVNTPTQLSSKGTLLEVRYESLIKDTSNELFRVFSFLEVEPNSDSASQEQLVNRKSYAELIPESQRHLHQNVMKGEIREDRDSAWRGELDKESVFVFECVAGEALSQRGYPVGVSHLTPLEKLLAISRKALAYIITLACDLTNWSRSSLIRALSNPRQTLRRQLAKRRKVT